jgi:hypothetical protein
VFAVPDACEKCLGVAGSGQADLEGGGTVDVRGFPVAAAKVHVLIDIQEAAPNARVKPDSTGKARHAGSSLGVVTNTGPGEYWLVGVE